jgi:hypothetical protein
MFFEEYKMPDEYKGKIIKNGGLTNFSPRKWTEKEIDWVLMLKEKSFSIKQIADFIDRDVVQVSIKIKRLGKKNKTYNEPHREEKYKTNEEFLNIIQPKSCLDVFSGEKSFWLNKVEHLIANDKNFESKVENNHFNMDAFDFLCYMWLNKNKYYKTYDIVDLDPFGSAYDCFDLSIKLAKKGIIITLGELGHKRFKRLDFVRRYYGIEKMEDFNTNNLINHIIKIGERNKKKLTPVFIKDWRNIARVYFKIEDLKIVEQWGLLKKSK